MRPAAVSAGRWEQIILASQNLGLTQVASAKAPSTPSQPGIPPDLQDVEEPESDQDDTEDEMNQASGADVLPAQGLESPPWVGPLQGNQGQLPTNVLARGIFPPGTPAQGRPSFAVNQAKAPPYQPNPNLIGSPKIQTAEGPSPAGSNPPAPQAPETPLTPAATPGNPVPEGLKVALEGTLGSTVESAVLPSFDAIYITLPGQSQDFDKFSIERLDFNIWEMAEPFQLYDNNATARFYTERTYQEGTQPTPTPPECTQEDIGSGLIKLVCKGDFPLANGHLLRVVSCGPPNQEILNNFEGRFPTAESKLAAYLGRAWIQGDQSLWDQDLCPDRQYLDYPFVGAVSHLVGVLQEGWVYLIAQFPKDYIVLDDEEKTAQNMEAYGPPVIVAPEVELGRYQTSRQMNNFLYNGSIVQVVVAKHSPEGTTGEFTNIALADLITARIIAEAPVEGVPTNSYCQGLSDWEADRVQMEDTLISLVNQARSQGASCGNQGTFPPNATALLPNATLRCAARLHSQNMSEENFFSHINPTTQYSELNRIFAAGTDPVLQPEGETAGPVVEGTLFANGGENIAKGLTDPQAVVNDWLASPGHCANMMNPSFTHLGAGYVPGGEGGPYWTLTLGTPWQ